MVDEASADLLRVVGGLFMVGVLVVLVLALLWHTGDGEAWLKRNEWRLVSVELFAEDAYRRARSMGWGLAWLVGLAAALAIALIAVL